jgi:hypothetical protein
MVALLQKAYGIWIWKEVENKAANLESKKRYFSV